MAVSRQEKSMIGEKLTNVESSSTSLVSPTRNRRQRTVKPFTQEEVRKLSEEKGRALFETEEDKLAWLSSVKESVEESIQSKVRAVLGTPPTERRIKKRQEEEAARRRKLELKVLSERPKEVEVKLTFRTRFEENFNLDIVGRKQHYLRTRETYFQRIRNGSSKSREIDLKEILDPVMSNKANVFFTTGAEVENLEFPFQDPIYVRAGGTIWTDHTGRSYQLEGPYWPRDHLPKYPNQNLIRTIPEFIEPLNTPAENRNVQIKEESSLYPRHWRGSIVVYDRLTKRNIRKEIPQGCAPSLQFESRFECGNLRQAKRVGSYEYDLVLSTDLYTNRHTQWYFFKIQQMVPGVTYKFNIINFRKRDSLYNYGMQPLFYSEKRAKSVNGFGWSRVGHHISYGRNFVYKSLLLSRDQIYYTLTFQLEFPHNNDKCYLAHCYPYSYTDLDLYLKTLEDSPLTSKHCKKEVMCKTLAGNNCYLLTVTSPIASDEKKLGVVISGRVHPGETNASWMMKGLVDFLTSKNHVAEKLRKKFVFKIIPMLNPDGVVVGNYRTNLAGRDLNRTYRNPKKAFYPTTWYMKALIEDFSKEHEVVIYCDLHGHSRKPNVFMYGCTSDNNMTSMNDFLEDRLFPWLLSQKAPDKFSFRCCKFKVHKRKESTARVVMWRQLGISNSFTMEATFCGANFGDMEKGRHFNTMDFEAMGRNFCEVLYEYSEARGTDKSEVTQAFVELACKMTRDILRQTSGTFRRVNNKISGTLTANDENNSSKSWLEKTHQRKESKRVNFVDVELLPGQVEPSDLADDGVEVSVRSMHVDSFNDCIRILDSLNLNDLFHESESSDSDSGDEDEDKTATSANTSFKNGESKKKKKKKKKKKDWWDILSKPQDEKKQEEKEVLEEEQEEEEENKQLLQKKVKVNFRKFLNPYAERHNGGIPTFSQERMVERAKKREKLEQDGKRRGVLLKYALDEPHQSYPLIAFADKTELNFITAQRRFACYMLTRNNPGAIVGNLRNEQIPGSDSANRRCPREQPVGPDSFKFNHHSGGGYGFTIRFPGTNDAARNDKNNMKENGILAKPALQKFEDPYKTSIVKDLTVTSHKPGNRDLASCLRPSTNLSNVDESTNPVNELYPEMLEQDFGERLSQNSVKLKMYPSPEYERSVVLSYSNFNYSGERINSGNAKHIKCFKS